MPKNSYPNMIKLTIIILLFSGYTALAQNSRSVPAARLVIDLGSSPWKFKKLTTQTVDDTIAIERTLVSGQTFPQTKLITLPSPTVIKQIKNSFKDTSIYRAFYKVEASVDKVHWVVLNDKTAAGELVNYQNINAVKATGSTVGYAENKRSAFIVTSVNGKYRFLKFTVTKLLNSHDISIPKSQGNLQLSKIDARYSVGKNYQATNIDDSKWQNVGIPHCYNDIDTYLNTDKSLMWHGAVWYRKHIKYNPAFAGKKVYLEFDGVNTGAAVYVNGKFKPGNTSVKQPADVTHIGGFLPFALDISDDLIPGKDNVIAVKVSNAQHDFFTWPGFAVYENFGMGWGGIVCPVKLYAVNKVHIPLNSYSPLNTWGTYNAVMAADSLNATVRLQTNVQNDDIFARKVILQTNITDSEGKIVKTIDIKKTIPAGKTQFFDTSLTIVHPHLWYPNNSPYGKPYLYKVTRVVEINGKPVDQETAQLGLRILTWDNNYCYVNHKKHLLNGFGNRNSYPALGSAVPNEIQWKDIKLIAEAGGNALRVGHVPATRQTLEACDVYGVLVMDNSGDNEWALKNEPANTYKQEYDRDMIINFRNYTCVAIWESNNGLAKDGAKYLPTKTQEIVDKWDSLQHRIISTRDGYPAGWDATRNIVVGYTNKFTKVVSSPSINTEVYGAFWDGRRSINIARDDYADEKAFSEWYVNDWLRDIENKACGWIDWMLAETQGEGYTTYLNGMSHQRSIGSSGLDGNRFPKLKYRIYRNALWVPFKTRPGVTLQSTWNLSGLQTVDAWSNCPQTELFLNGKSLGKRTPDARTTQISWPDVVFQPGKLKIVGLDDKGKIACADSLVTAGKPDHIVLTVEKNLVAPDGSKFTIKANGSDAAIIKAMIVDKNGNWCPDADNNIQFNISGEADYKGSYNFYVTADKPSTYHSPGDHELAAEGGQMKIAIRSRFKSGPIVVHASSTGLTSAITSFMIYKNQ